MITKEDKEIMDKLRLQDIGVCDFLKKDKPKAKISYGKKGKRKSIEVKQ